MKGTFSISKFAGVRTPFYYYDTDLLQKTLDTIKTEAGRYENFEVHYAIKANANPKVLSIIAHAGLGADCVSGGEIEAALKAGFPASKIVFAGVGKADWEINLGLDADIFCFNVESVPELEVINELAAAKARQHTFVSESILTWEPIRMPISRQDWQRTSSVLPWTIWKASLRKQQE